MKISDLIISAILKRGIFCDGRKIKADIEIPGTNIKMHIEADNMTISIMKDEEET